MLSHVPRRLAGLAVALAGAVLLTPAAAVAAEKGVAPDMAWMDSIAGSDQDRTAAHLENVGARWVRLDLSWQRSEPIKGVYDPVELAGVDRAVNLARAAGSRIVMLVSDAPLWANGSTNKSTPPRDMRDYASFLRFAAGRYRGQVEAWEIWNEPNIPRFWPAGPDPGAYAGMLKAAHPAVKAGNPDAKVVTAGLSFNDYDFLEAAYAAEPDLGDYFDVMGTHPYTLHAAAPEAVERTSSGRIAKHSFSSYRELRATMAAHGDVKPIWFTEFGWATTTNGGELGGVDPATQAEYLTRAYEYIEQDADVEVAIWYSFRNMPWARDADTWEDQLGLMTTDYTPKPSYHAFRDYTPPAAPAARTPDAQVGPTVTPPVDPGTDAPTPTRTTINVGPARRSGVTTSRVRVTGRVSNVGSGRVQLRIQRRASGRWSWYRTLTARVTGGRYSRYLSLSTRSRWRVRAVFAGGNGRARSASRPAAVSVARSR